MIGQLVAAGCILLAYAVAVMVLTPVLLTRRRWTSRVPRASISLWMVALASGAVAMLVSFGCSIAAASDLASRPRAPLTVHDAVAGIGLTLGACLMTAVGGGLVCAALYQAVSGAVLRRRLTAGAGGPRGPRRGRVPATVVHSRHATAISVPGRHPAIVVSSRLADALSAAELEAVIEHERGHLLQHHHLLVQLANLQYRCAPALPCARSMERAVHLLVELAADDHAARRCGRRTTASALRSMAGHTGDPGFELRASRLERRELAGAAGA